MTATRQFIGGRVINELRGGYVRIKVAVEMLATDEGGRGGAVHSGYRPLCFFGSVDAQPVGLCDLELVGVEALVPGASGEGVLRFDRVHAELLKTLAIPGAKVGLGEGERIIAWATVISVPQFPAD